MSLEEVLRDAIRRNPELAALSADIRSRRQSARLANLQKVPDFSLSAGTDRGGAAQDLVGMVTVPFLRADAINAAIAQSEANLKVADALQRQTRFALQSRVVSDVAFLRGVKRAPSLFDDVIIPRMQQGIEATRASYEVGHTSMPDVLESQRTLVATRRLVARLKVAGEKRRVDVYSITTVVR